jgi:hypothetical protein
MQEDVQKKNTKAARIPRTRKEIFCSLTEVTVEEKLILL